MKVVLLENVKKLGKKDEIVEVSDGYARNVIIAKKLGVEATSVNLNNLRLKNKNEEKKEENLRNIAIKNKSLLESNTYTIKIKTGETGRTFGSITNKEIVDAVYDITKIEIDRKNVLLDDSIKHIGNYDVDVKLHKDIIAKLKIKVEEE